MSSREKQTRWFTVHIAQQSLKEIISPKPHGSTVTLCHHTKVLPSILLRSRVPLLLCNALSGKEL